MSQHIAAAQNRCSDSPAPASLAERLGGLPERVVVVRALPGLGDFLCAVPALRALRAALPHAHIALVGLPAVGPLVERFSRYLDELIEFPGWPGIPERPPIVEALPAFLTAMHARRFDLALQLHGSGATSNAFAVLLGARVTAGCYVPGQYCPDPARCLPYPDHEPEIRRLLQALAFLGIPPRGEHLEFPILPADRQAFAALGPAVDLPRGAYVCLHAGASTPQRRWAPEHFARLADAAIRRGLRVVLTGSAQEGEVAREIAARLQAPALDLTGRTSLGALAVLLRGARLLVCNDTGVSHLAAALRVPSVVVFTASDPARWAPLDRQRHRAIRAGAASPAEAPAWAAALAAVDELLREEAADVA